MAVNYNDETWLYVKNKIEALVEKQKSLLINHDTSYKDLLRAQGAVAALKTVLELPHTATLLAATRRG